MSIPGSLKVILYRYAEKGLEVLLQETDDNKFKIPGLTEKESLLLTKNNEHMMFDDNRSSNIKHSKVVAVSLDDKFLDKDDATSRTLQQWFHKNQNNKYVALKEVFKKVLPNEYALLKEFKDILTDRNSTNAI
jgi:hypothetical protein